MAVRDRMKKYREEGGGAGLACEQVLVPPEARVHFHALAAEFRRLKRERDQKGMWRLKDRLALALGADPEMIQSRNSFARFPNADFELKETCANDW